MGKRFIETCKRCKKPIIAIKSGKTPIGIKAASSHTAALASEEGVYEGIFSQCKIIEADSVKQMFLIAELLVKYKNIGNNACVVTNGGGIGVLCSDYCFKLGINLPMLPNNILKKLDEFLPEGWSKNNPIDILGDAKAELYAKTLDILENENFFDFYIILLTPQYMTEPYKTAEILLEMSMKKPILSCFMGGNKVENARQVLSKNNILVFDDVKDLCEVLGKVVKTN